jgi:rubrerythrin/uncharacterized membrane protein
MKWVCTICKYVHEGDEPPDICPVCKKGKEFFEPVGEPADEEEEPTASEKTEDVSTERRWYCTVCRYIHVGDSPPDECPVCKKPWTAFVPHEDGQEHAPPAPPAPKKEAVVADRWRCVVCNYVHDGPEPPDVCPVCGKNKDYFEPETESPEHHHQGLSGLIERLHLHPVTAHFPNGALPLALLAWIAYLVTGEASLERTATYLVFIAMAAAPVTFYSGWSDAKHRFGTTTTGVFPEKKLWSWVLMVVAMLTVGFRFWAGWTEAPSGLVEVGGFSALLLVGNALTARLGMLGGKLVFGH